MLKSLLISSWGSQNIRYQLVFGEANSLENRLNTPQSQRTFSIMITRPLPIELYTELFKNNLHFSLSVVRLFLPPTTDGKLKLWSLNSFHQWRRVLCKNWQNYLENQGQTFIFYPSANEIFFDIKIREKILSLRFSLISTSIGKGRKICVMEGLFFLCILNFLWNILADH